MFRLALAWLLFVFGRGHRLDSLTLLLDDDCRVVSTWGEQFVHHAKGTTHGTASSLLASLFGVHPCRNARDDGKNYDCRKGD